IEAAFQVPAVNQGLAGLVFDAPRPANSVPEVVPYMPVTTASSAPAAPARAEAESAARAATVNTSSPGSTAAPTATGPTPRFLGPFGTPLRQYGYAVFSSYVSTFAPIDDVPVGPDYVVGPGDNLTISIWGPLENTVIRTVDRSGQI